MMIKKEDKKILENIKKTRKWSEKTHKDYTNAVKSYTQFTKKTLTELIHEAENEEIQGLRWKQRKIRKRLINFRAHLYNKHIIRTAKTYLSRIKTIYTNFEIEIHQLPPISEKNTKQRPPLYYKDLPTKKIIKQACDISNPLMTAIILFMSSSGSARTETLNLTIKDFLKSTKRYHKKEIHNIPSNYEEKIINEIINNLISQKELIPDWDMKRQKTNKYYRTYSSTESTKAIINYLISREDKLKFNSPLFKIGKGYCFRKFNIINEELGLGTVGETRRFRTHMLRKYHSSNIRKTTTDTNGNKIKGMKSEYIDALQGRTKTGTRKSYYFDDYEDLRDSYITHHPKITIYDNNDMEFKTSKYLELEKQKEQEIQAKEKVISNFASENIELKEENEKFKENVNKKIESLQKVQDLLLDKLK